MTAGDFLNLLFVIFLVVANGFFVAAEFALVKVRGSEIEILAQEGKWTAQLAHSILGRMDAYLSMCQLGITLASLGLGWVGEPVVAHLLEPVLGLFGITGDSVHHISVVIGFSTITFLHITVGEQVPKIMAIQAARKTTLFSSPILVFFYKVFRPFIWALNQSSNLMLRLIGIDVVSEHEQTHSEEELRMILAESSRGGGLSRGEHLIMENVLNLEDKLARQVMVPRNDIVILDVNQTLEQSYEVVAASSHTRFPLCDGNLDQVVGMVHSKALLRALISQDKIDSLKGVSQTIQFFPETVRLDALMRDFLRDHRHLAMLVDEYGVVSGMVTFEDILEQLVGPIQDEFDRELPFIKKVDSKTFEVDAMCPLDHIATRFQLELPVTDADTAGGLVSELLGHIPAKGESITVSEHQLIVTAADETRVRKLQLVKPNDGPAPTTPEPTAKDKKEDPSKDEGKK